MKNLSPLHVESRVSWLAHTASACLIDEARLSPKPGLVDSRGNGAHQDLNLALMERSARSLQPTFHALAQQKAALQAMHCPEADWFIEHCLPCYTQNLDELTRQQ